MTNLPPGVTESMLPGNRPEDEWYDKFFDSIGVPTGIVPYCDPRLIAELVTKFLGLLQRMNVDAFNAGVAEGKLQAKEPDE